MFSVVIVMVCILLIMLFFGATIAWGQVHDLRNAQGAGREAVTADPNSAIRCNA